MGNLTLALLLTAAIFLIPLKVGDFISDWKHKYRYWDRGDWQGALRGYVTGMVTLPDGRTETCIESGTRGHTRAMRVLRWFVKPKHKYRAVGAVLAVWVCTIIMIGLALQSSYNESVVGFTVPVVLLWLGWWIVAARKREGDIRWFWKILYRGAGALLVLWCVLMMISVKSELGWFDPDSVALLGSAWKLWCVWWLFVMIVRARRRPKVAVASRETIEPDN